MARILIEKNKEQKSVEDSEYWETYQRQGWRIATKSTPLLTQSQAEETLKSRNPCFPLYGGRSIGGYHLTQPDFDDRWFMTDGLTMCIYPSEEEAVEHIMGNRRCPKSRDFLYTS